MGALGLTETAIKRIRAHEQVIEIGLRIDDEELAHAVLDLSRTARREMVAIGLIPSFTEQRASSYEMILTQHLMPEIASRLNGTQTRLILSREEVGEGSASGTSGAELRRMIGVCWSSCDFARIGSAVRVRFDPDGKNAGRVFATEVIGQDPCNGNLMEMALSRVAAPTETDPSAETDWIGARIMAAGRLRGLERPGPVWSPGMNFGPGGREEPATDPDLIGPEPV